VAWALLAFARRLETLRPRLGATLGIGLVLALSLSSFVGLKRAEALSLYSSARSHISRGDLAGGVHSLQKALDQPHTAALPLADVYFLLCTSMPYLSENPTPYLKQALLIAPDHLGLQATQAVIEQQSAEMEIRKRGDQHLRSIREQIKKRGGQETFARNLAATYHNVGIGAAKQGNFPAAIHALTSALAIDTNKENSRRALCNATLFWAEDIEAAGHPGQALFLYRQLLAIDPPHAEARAQCERLSPDAKKEAVAPPPDPQAAYAILYRLTDTSTFPSSTSPLEVAL
jgi:tetratricopeptide (TPR) repeat protein